MRSEDSSTGAQSGEAQSTVAAATVLDPEARGSEAHITIEMTRPDGVKVRKMLGGGRACNELQYPAESQRQRWRREPPRAISDEERAIHAMCLSALERVSETIPS